LLTIRQAENTNLQKWQQYKLPPFRKRVKAIIQFAPTKKPRRLAGAFL
jgi:hypothetical protein